MNLHIRQAPPKALLATDVHRIYEASLRLIQRGEFHWGAEATFIFKVSLLHAATSLASGMPACLPARVCFTAQTLFLIQSSLFTVEGVQSQVGGKAVMRDIRQWQELRDVALQTRDPHVLQTLLKELEEELAEYKRQKHAELRREDSNGDQP